MTLARKLILTDPKDPNDTLDYQLSWDSLLSGDTILTSEWIAPDGITVESEDFDETTTTIWLSGGSPGHYDFVNRITTVGGRTYDQTMRVPVQEL